MSLPNIPISSLISAPLVAIGEAQKSLSQTTIDFIKSVGLTDDNIVRTIEFTYNYTDDNGDLKSFNISVPILAILKIPSLYINKADISFILEVDGKIKETNNTNTNNESMPFTLVGKLSSKQKSERTTNRSATYTLAISAIDEGVPEGLARLLDLLTSVVPTSL